MNKKISKFLDLLPFIILFLLVAIVYKTWFFPGLITAGDFWPLFVSMYDNRPINLYAWDWGYSSGMGGFVGSLLWVYLNFGLATTVWGKFMGFDWAVVERLAYFYPFLAICVVGSFLIFKKLLDSSKAAVISSGIFSFNTYILMLVGGGQVAGVGMAYALTPIVLYSFIISISRRNTSFKKSVLYSALAALMISIQIVYDLRIAYVTILAIFIYGIFYLLFAEKRRDAIVKIIIGILPTFVLTTLLNMFWVLPTLFNHSISFAELGETYTSVESLKYFSFGRIEYSASLLHPYWPENIFGLVPFFNPFFLILPLLAFTSLLFLHSNKKFRKLVLFFCTLGIVGIFLAKGSNEPFGILYIWMFENVPGFVMFRDPFKWYVLIILSYSFLIPFSILNIFNYLETVNRKLPQYSKYIKFQYAWVIIVTCTLITLISPALFNKLDGNFKNSVIPSEYEKLEQFLDSQTKYSRTMWVPTVQRYGYYSANHPSISGRDFFHTYNDSELIKIFQSESTEEILQELSIKYVIVPFDAKEEIYLTDRKYDPKLYSKTLSSLSNVSYLNRIDEFKNIGVFEVSNPKNHFWHEDFENIIEYRKVSPVEYSLLLENVNQNEKIFFTEKYDSAWVLKTPYEIVASKSYKVGSAGTFEYNINSFEISQSGSFPVTIYYSSQDLVKKGTLVSGFTLVTMIAGIGFIHLSNRRSKNGN